jgi:hypothetical protein
MRPPRRLLPLVLVMLVLVAACERARETPPPDTIATDPTLPPDTAAIPSVSTSAWLRAAGPVLAVPGGGPGDAVIVFPELTDTTISDTVRFESTRAEGLVLDLFDRSGRGTQDTVARMPPHEWTEGCIDWPSAALRGAPLRWTMGFAAGRVTAIPLDSIEGMPAQDSASLAATLARIASTMPDSGEVRFRGLPFRVRTAYRFHLADSTAVIVADLVRLVTVEANPREEHTLLIAERDSAAGELRIVYYDRRAGSEETLEAVELLGAVRLGADAHPALVLVHVGYETTAYALLERLGGEWRQRWRSVTTGC